MFTISMFYFICIDLWQHFPAKDLEREPESREIEGSCPVCGDRVSGYHYGLLTCESCKVDTQCHHVNLTHTYVLYILYKYIHINNIYMYICRPMYSYVYLILIGIVSGSGSGGIERVYWQPEG